MKQKRKEFNLFKFVSQVVLWLGVNLLVNPSLPIHLYQSFIERLDLVKRSRGSSYAVDYCKAIRGNLMNYLSDNPIRDPIAKCNKEGLPIVLGPLMEYFRKKSVREIALVFTILFSTRALKLGKKPDFETITQPCKRDVNYLSKHMASFWKELGYRPALSRKPRSLNAFMDDYRVKSGPNGHALTTAHHDLEALPEELIKSLITLGGYPIEKTFKTFEDGWLSKFMEYAGVFNWKESKGLFRRLSYFPDKEKKVRVVGIMDYYSQLALKPLHNYLGRALSKIRQDCTLDQGKFKDLLLNRSEIDKFYSIDLSAATDRFPIEIIFNLLSKQLPLEYVKAWRDTMVGYPFDCDGVDYVYSVGNPMGAYSSFNSFALAHHYIIYYCCRELGISWKGLPYSLLGDDIVIGDSRVGEMYKKVISSTGVEFSLAKTHESLYFFEFAKRMFYKGEEITPFPISGLKEARKHFSMLTTLLVDTERKGYIFSDIPSSVSSFFGIVMNMPSRFRKKSMEGSWLFKGVLLTVQGKVKANEFINELIRTYNYPLPELSEEICKNIYSNCAVEAFADSNIMKSLNFNWDQVPLAGIDSDLVQKLYRFGQEEWWDDDIELEPILDELPISRAAKAVQNLYDNLQKDLNSMDSTGADWSYHMRNFALPNSDKTVLERSNYALSRSVNTFATLLRQRMDVLVQFPQLLEM